jgi:hypothetical protein
MNIWSILEWVAWGLSAIMLVWMVVDAFKVGQQFSEEQLLSSKEGVDELFAAEQKRGQ